MSRDGDNIAAGCFLLWLLVCLAGAAAVVIAAVHFVMKVW